jgi:hypothetical protein
MNTKQLLVPLALIGICLVGTIPAAAAVISFIEDPADTAAIVVKTDIAGATIGAGVESASLRARPEISESTFERVKHGFTTQSSYHILWW